MFSIFFFSYGIECFKHFLGLQRCFYKNYSFCFYWRKYKKKLKNHKVLRILNVYSQQVCFSHSIWKTVM